MFYSIQFLLEYSLMRCQSEGGQRGLGEVGTSGLGPLPGTSVAVETTTTAERPLKRFVQGEVEWSCYKACLVLLTCRR